MRGRVRALDGIDLLIRPREAVGLVGSRGAGKTTLLDCISGLVRPARGRIYMEERLLTRRAPFEIARLGVTRTFAVPRMFRRLSVIDNVRPFVPTGGSPRPAQMFARMMLGLVGLDERAADPIEALTPFELRRLELARALAPGPRLILLDEPARGLSGREARTMLGLIRRLALPHAAVLIAEVEPELTRELCPRTLVLEAGRKLRDGPAGPAMLAPPNETVQRVAEG
ncbi:MAG TPA: ATP-binding cassette domain-containing protein [Hyphomicrobiaceae bacterium]|nr:ATP-binding cassette domain-containing protein [Hyphomicrobiaceae bacterium]